MRCLILVAAALVVTACAAEKFPPALPDERTVLEPPPASPPAPAQAPAPESLTPLLRPTPEEWWAFEVQRPPGKTERPEKVIASANAHSRVPPSRSGYAAGHRSIQHYPYLPGRVYEVYSSPNNPTALILPPGERLAAPPALNPEAWEVGVIEMGQEEARQEAVVVRPLAPGVEATTHLFTQSGRGFFCRLRAFETTSMVAVTWDLPVQPPQARSASWHPPTLDPSRLHTAYRIETVQGTPPWVPLSVYDDGTKTVIRCKEALGFTTAPGLFARNADGSPSLVQFTPYTVPEQPEQGAYYVVQGLWPHLELQGNDGMTVRITRHSGQPTPSKEARDGR